MRTLKVIGFSLVCAALLFTFAILQSDSIIKYAFSLGALYLGIQFFRRNEAKGMRIAFVITTIGMYFIYTVFYAVYLAAQQQGMV